MFAWIERLRKRPLLLLLLGIPALLLAIGALVGLSLWLSVGMRDTTHRFLGAMRTGQYDMAYQLTSAEVKATVPPDQFVAWVDRSAPNVRRSISDWVNGYSTGSFLSACMDVWLYGSGEGHTPVYLLLVKQNGSWLVTTVTEREPSECAASAD